MTTPTSAAPSPVAAPRRLESLDVLRGFTLFVLVFAQPVFMAFTEPVKAHAVIHFLRGQLRHEVWEGFSAWDMVMPNFLFMAGVSMPFALPKLLALHGRRAVYAKVLKRVAILWVLGMFVQGNLLALDLDVLKPYSNTLQAIAAGYLIATVLMLHLSRRGQVIATAALLIGYWALIAFTAGGIQPDVNLAEQVDNWVLGRFRDGTQFKDGVWSPSPWYHYTWILSSMVFGVTVMIGVFAGRLIKEGAGAPGITRRLLVLGAALMAAGWLLSWHTPFIKPIWSASMTLWAGGISVLLLAAFHWLIDVRQAGRWLLWLKVYGMNSIVAYCLGEAVDFGSVSATFVGGFEAIAPALYPAIVVLGSHTIVLLIVWFLYRQRVFVAI